jgi:acetate kinase
LEKIGETGSALSFRTVKSNAMETLKDSGAKDHAEGFDRLLGLFGQTGILATGELVAIGHRVVHGGTQFSQATPVTPDVMEAIRDLIPLAPLHNPANLLGIEIAAQKFPGLPQVAVFDTAFHRTLAPAAYRYAIPDSWYENLGIRRYGFHGTAHQYLARRVSQQLGRPAHLITLHLGNGASASAIRAGVCIDTSMGFTPLEGLVMGTRSGDLDPAAVLCAVEQRGSEAVMGELQRESGLKGLCGSNDLREILARMAEGDQRAQLAVEIYCQRIQKYLGAYYAILGQVDALVFSGGVGENAALIRARICEGLDHMGIILDPAKNAMAPDEDLKEIQADSSRLGIYIVRANEELEIARQTVEVLAL